MKELENFVRLQRDAIFYINNPFSSTSYLNFCLNPDSFKIWFPLVLFQVKHRLNSLSRWMSRIAGDNSSYQWDLSEKILLWSSCYPCFAPSRCAFRYQSTGELFIALGVASVKCVPSPITPCLLTPHPLSPFSRLLLSHQPCFPVQCIIILVINISFSTE